MTDRLTVQSEVSRLTVWTIRSAAFDIPLQEDATTLLGLTKEEERLMGLLGIVRSINLRAQLCQPYLLR